MSSETLVKNSFYAYADYLSAAALGWLFWLMVSRISAPSEIGLATTVLSLVSVVGGFLGLGMEYVLLRNSGRPGVYLTTVIFELGILGLISPLFFFTQDAFYGPSFSAYMLVGIAFLLINGVQYLSKHFALGLLKTPGMFVFDSAAALLRLSLGIGLIFVGLGGIGILYATLAQSALASVGFIYISRSALHRKILRIKEFLPLISLGLGNFPRKVAELATSSLIVVFLALFYGDPAAVGTFYVAFTITLVASGLANSLALVSIPSSKLHGIDLTDTSLRYGLALTAPIVALLTTSPTAILSLVGQAYVVANSHLQLLALSIVPNTIILNAVAQFNHHEDSKKLLITGAVQFGVLIALVGLINLYGAFGAALTVLMASSAAATISAIWMGRTTIRPLVASGIAIAVGSGLGMTLTPVSEILGGLVALSASMAAILSTRIVTIGEIRGMLRLISRRS